jgi:hypothetical protein
MIFLYSRGNGRRMDGSLDGSEEPVRRQRSNIWGDTGRRERREIGMVVPISMVILQMILIQLRLKAIQNHSKIIFAREFPMQLLARLNLE